MGLDQSFEEMKRRRTMGIIIALAVIILFTVFIRVRGGGTVPLRPVDDGLILSGKNGETQSYIRYDNIDEMELRTELEPGNLAGEEKSAGNYRYGLYENDELGRFMFYRYDKNNRFIVVTLKEEISSSDGGNGYKHVVFNYGSEVDTEEAFRAFKEAWQKLSHSEP